MAEKDQLLNGVSPETDELASTLMGDALDLLAAGDSFCVLLAVQSTSGEVTSYEFEDDGPEACLEAARAKVAQVTGARRYAIVYEGAVETGADGFVDALLLEFGERGYRSYSAYSLVGGKGTGDGFTWTDPAPAGEVAPLL